MNIDKLLNKRQHNVQEQNAILKNRIASEAAYWRRKGLPDPSNEKFILLNIDVNTSIVLEYVQDFPGICSDEGTIVTEAGKFYIFAADLSHHRTKLVEWYDLVDVTEDIVVTKHNKGTGLTWGYLAIEVLNELNS